MRELRDTLKLQDPEPWLFEIEEFRKRASGAAAVG